MPETKLDPATASAEKLQFLRSASGKFLRGVNDFTSLPANRQLDADKEALRVKYTYTAKLYREFQDDFVDKDVSDALSTIQKADAGYQRLFGEKPPAHNAD